MIIPKNTNVSAVLTFCPALWYKLTIETCQGVNRMKRKMLCLFVAVSLAANGVIVAAEEVFPLWTITIVEEDHSDDILGIANDETQPLAEEKKDVVAGEQGQEQEKIVPEVAGEPQEVAPEVVAEPVEKAVASIVLLAQAEPFSAPKTDWLAQMEQFPVPKFNVKIALAKAEKAEAECLNFHTLKSGATGAIGGNLAVRRGEFVTPLNVFLVALVVIFARQVIAAVKEKKVRKDCAIAAGIVGILASAWYWYKQYQPKAAPDVSTSAPAAAVPAAEPVEEVLVFAA